MFSRLLIANRGEIACRVARTARGMGMSTVAVYTPADRDALHVAAGDMAVAINSYLDVGAVLEAAAKTGAQAIHPGYGFLSEHAGFAQACADAGLVFVGPSPEAIRIMGDKAAAKAKMIEAGVPVVPGYQGADQSGDGLAKEAAAIGYPVLVKAVAGGGGRGMRRVDAVGDLAEALASARREAKSAFGSDAVLLERLVEDGRHVEVQVFGDRHGNVVHLGERDCSAQRRHQKIVEESPSPAVDEALRAKLGAWAVAAASSVGYVGAGTVEFMLDADGNAFFLEMNTRLQVEHPVTEMVTGTDLVEWQLRVASGEALPATQEAIALSGHAIEARLYAEDPYRDFLPQTGRILRFRPVQGEGLRVDAGVAEGGSVGADYDPMVAKFIAHGADRTEAIARLKRLIADTPLVGVANNAGFLSRLLSTPAFLDGGMTTATIDVWTAARDGLLAAPQASRRDFIAAACVTALAPGGDWFRSTGVAECPVTLGFGGATELVRLCFERGRLARATARGEASEIEAARWDGETLALSMDGVEDRFGFTLDGPACHLARDGEVLTFVEPDLLASGGAQADPRRIVTPASGRVTKVPVSPGDRIEEGSVVMVIEAMKMETALTARAAGTVAAVHAGEGDQVQAGEIVVELAAGKDAR